MRNHSSSYYLLYCLKTDIMTNSSSQQPLLYRSLDDIKMRKQELRRMLQRDNGEISQIWNGLLARPEVNTPTNRIQGLMSKSIGIIDGALLGWKLYQRLKPGKKKRKTNFLLRLIS